MEDPRLFHGDNGWKRRRRQVWPRDSEFLKIGEKSILTIEDFCPGCLNLGAAGAGKTTGLHRVAVKAALRSGWGMLILTVKKDSVDQYRELIREEGRERDLILIDEKSGNVLDWIGYEIELAGGQLAVENIKNQLRAVTSLIQGSKGDASDPFWPNAASNLTGYSITIIHLAYSRLDVDLLLRFLHSVPITPEQLETKRTFFFRETIDLAIKNCPPERQYELDAARSYFSGEWIGLGNKTSSSVLITATTPLNPLKSGLLRNLLSPASDHWHGESTWTPRDAINGAVILIAVPSLDPVYGLLGAIVQIILKALFIRTIHARDMSEEYDFVRPLMLVSDECQRTFDEQTDKTALETIRSSKACFLGLTQNIPNFQVEAKDRRSSVDSFLGNFGLRVFNQNLCPVTNKFASDTLGQRLVERRPVGEQYGGGAPGHDPNRPASVSVTQQFSWEPWLQESAFTVLRTGNKHSKGYIDSYVINKGQTFEESGKPYLKVTFDRKKNRPWWERWSGDAQRPVVKIVARKEYQDDRS